MDKPVGLTKSVGFQIGVRRTLPITPEKAWQLLLSQEGLQLWLGDLSSLPCNLSDSPNSRKLYRDSLKLAQIWEVEPYE